MAKKVIAEIKLQIPAGAANPSPPVGPALGQRGVNIMEFCKAFNAQTQAQAGLIIPVVITVYADRSFTFITKTPPGVDPAEEGGRAREGLERSRGKTKVGKVTRAQVEEIARAEDARSHRGRRSRRRCARSRARRAASGSRWWAEQWRRHEQAIREAAAQGRPERRYARWTRLLRARWRPAATAKFDETVEIAIRLGVDPRQADQNVRGTVVAAARHRARPCASSCSPRARRRARRRRRAPTSLAARSSSKRSRTRIGSTSTRPSRPPT